MNQRQYLFGDTDLAALRLKVLAEVFAASSKAFLQNINHKPRLVLDLGCGPGYSTHFLATLFPSAQIVGLDNSISFLTLAQQTATDKVSFVLHDITTVPFPQSPADLLYCRFLLTHLRDPHSIVARWATQLRPQGLLLIEEVEWIRTRHPVFSQYLDMVEAMLKEQSNTLYVGPILGCLEDSERLPCSTNLVREMAVSNRQAATMFFLNLQSWKHRPFIQTHYTGQTVAQLETDLQTLVQKPPSQTEITWGMRQLCFIRI